MNVYLTDNEIIKYFGKSIFDMSVEELRENKLIDNWAYLLNQECNYLYDNEEE